MGWIKERQREETRVGCLLKVLEEREEDRECVYQNGIVFEAFVGICMERLFSRGSRL
jgi:hypothetical protein